MLRRAREHGLRGKRADKHSLFHAPTGHWTTHDDDAARSPLRAPGAPLSPSYTPDPTFAQNGKRDDTGSGPSFRTHLVHSLTPTPNLAGTCKREGGAKCPSSLHPPSFPPNHPHAAPPRCASRVTSLLHTTTVLPFLSCRHHSGLIVT